MRAVKLAVPRGAEVTVNTSPISTVPPIVIVLICITGITEVTEFVLSIDTPEAVQLKPIILAVVSVNDGDVVKVASVPVPETTRIP